MKGLKDNRKILPLDMAKELINRFTLDEYDEPADFNDLSKIDILYTTITDDDISVQVCIDLEHNSLSRFLGNRLVEKREYDSLHSLVKGELLNLDFADLSFFDDDVVEEARLWALEHCEPDDAGPAGASNQYTVEDTETEFVSEYCSNCETEIEMRWDVKTLGYMAFCPVCGKRLMLCDACRHPIGGPCSENCDYSFGAKICRHNKEGDV